MCTYGLQIGGGSGGCGVGAALRGRLQRMQTKAIASAAKMATMTQNEVGGDHVWCGTTGGEGGKYGGGGG